MLREAVSSVDDYEFEIEDQLERQVGTIPLPFPKMDSEFVVRVALSQSGMALLLPDREQGGVV